MFSLTVLFEVQMDVSTANNIQTSIDFVVNATTSVIAISDDTSTKTLPDTATHVAQLFGNTADVSSESANLTQLSGDTTDVGVDKLIVQDEIMDGITWGDLCSKCEEMQRCLWNNDDGTQVVCTCDVDELDNGGNIMEDISWGASIASEDIATLEG